MTRNLLIAFSVLLVLGSCKKADIDGEKFSRTKIERFLTRDGKWYVRDFQNPNNFTATPYFFTFGDDENDEVFVQGQGIAAADSLNQPKLVELNPSNNNFEYRGTFEVDKRNPKTLNFRSSNGNHTFEFLDLEKDEAVIKRVNIGQGFEDEIYKIKFVRSN